MKCSYSDFVNNMKNGEKEGKELSVGVTVLYTKFDTYVVEEERREVRNRWSEWWEHRDTRRCSSEREICFYFVKLGWEVCLFYQKDVPEKAGIMRNRLRLLPFAWFEGYKQLTCTTLGFDLKHKFSLLDGPKNVSFVQIRKSFLNFELRCFTHIRLV